VWSKGVRRVGKTSLARTLDDIEYFDCELPRVRRAMEDSEEFLGSLRGKRVVLDEVHRLANPSELLKNWAPAWPLSEPTIGEGTWQLKHDFGPKPGALPGARIRDMVSLERIAVSQSYAHIMCERSDPEAMRGPGAMRLGLEGLPSGAR
jgi:hypothetical protein